MKQLLVQNVYYELSDGNADWLVKQGTISLADADEGIYIINKDHFFTYLDVLVLMNPNEDCEAVLGYGVGA